MKKAKQMNKQQYYHIMAALFGIWACVAPFAFFRMLLAVMCIITALMGVCEQECK